MDTVQKDNAIEDVIRNAVLININVITKDIIQDDTEEDVETNYIAFIIDLCSVDNKCRDFLYFLTCPLSIIERYLEDA